VSAVVVGLCAAGCATAEGHRVTTRFENPGYACTLLTAEQIGSVIHEQLSDAPPVATVTPGGGGTCTWSSSDYQKSLEIYLNESLDATGVVTSISVPGTKDATFQNFDTGTARRDFIVRVDLSLRAASTLVLEASSWTSPMISKSSLIALASRVAQNLAGNPPGDSSCPSLTTWIQNGYHSWSGGSFICADQWAAVNFQIEVGDSLTHVLVLYESSAGQWESVRETSAPENTNSGFVSCSTFYPAGAAAVLGSPQHIVPCSTP